MFPYRQKFNSQEQTKTWPVFRLAFRPFFWFGALFGTLSIGGWALAFTNNIEFSPLGGSYFWHAHEMLFGFSIAIVAGFLLTAVQTWTGVPSVKGKPLAMLVILWMLARILLAFPWVFSEYFIMAVDLLFLPLVALFLSIPVIKAQMWRNLFFVPILLIMAFLNGGMYLSLKGIISVSFLVFSHTMILMITLVMCIMGGRVFPMFTANGTKTQRVSPIVWLERLSIMSILMCILVTSKLINFSQTLEASVFLIAGFSNFVRAFRWRIWVAFNTPLVWSLHISYWSICMGLIMMGLEKMNFLGSISLALHAITVGGVGVMVLSMISRVSLGHTGRVLKVDKVMAFAFMMIVLAFIARTLALFIFEQYMVFILLSAALWIIAYIIFLIIYFPILFKSRVDGLPG